MRTQLADLKKQLADVNKQIEANNKQGRYDAKLSQQSIGLSESINKLSQQVDQFDLRIANALWGEKTYPFKKDYLDTVDKYFGSGHLRLADFKNDYPGERAIINKDGFNGPRSRMEVHAARGREPCAGRGVQ